MELILINEKKLKIMLTPEDMREYEIDCESVDYARAETRRAFWSILDEAKHRTGFDAASERVYIQLYPSREGGCEMFVTRLSCAAGESAKRPSAPQRRGAFFYPSMSTTVTSLTFVPVGPVKIRPSTALRAW